MRRIVPIPLVTGLAAATLMLFAAGSAFAVSSGGYSPPQQDCPWTAGNWATPQQQSYPGCHNIQISVESGGETGGNPNNGYNNSPSNGDHGKRNTTWVQYGNDQSPIDNNAKGTPTLLSIGEPGQTTSPHAGCLSVNTDGTNGGAAPASTKPTSQSKANGQQTYGCGNNTKGAGFALTYDYYQYYCPVADAAGVGSCVDPASTVSPTKLTLDTGTKQNITDVLSQGLLLYYGMDDNFDNGEHDGEGPGTSPQTAGSINGPSDGGAVVVAFTPQSATASPTLTRPEGLLNASLGFCADGNCAAATTEQETVYQGCNANTGNNASQDKCSGKNGKNSSRDVYNYDGKQTDPYNCSSGGNQGSTSPQPDSPSQCDTSASNQSPSGSKNSSGGMDYWRQQEAHNVYAEPGVQEYEDPDAEGSPAAPIYPNPAVYTREHAVSSQAADS